VSRTNAAQLKQARGFLFYLMKGLEALPVVKATVYAAPTAPVPSRMPV
jgi:hypothetical protein